MDNERIKAKLTIELDFAKDDQHLIAGVLRDVIDNLAISNRGNGSVTAASHYSYNLFSNLPSEPVTLDRLFQLFDEAADPGEPTFKERILDSLHPEYEQALEWWESLSARQQEWFIQKYPGVKLASKAYEVYRAMDAMNKAMIQALK
ncbi:hypothetical protein R3Q56_006706 [Pseudomonas aeruginosa]|nr:hypothetical protein [Pseudomonas aeruginosa]ELR2942334.1 hypothetical protein [Pseudomonas aeruginosa]